MELQLINVMTAIGAKKKGYKQEIGGFYFDNEGNINNCQRGSYVWKKCSDKNDKNVFFAPTQAMLQKWLRDEHQIHVEPTLNFTNEDYPMQFNCGVMYNIKTPDEFKWLGCECSYTFYKTYEEALENGLQEALELIK